MGAATTSSSTTLAASLSAQLPEAAVQRLTQELRGRRHETFIDDLCSVFKRTTAETAWCSGLHRNCVGAATMSSSTTSAALTA